LESSQPEIKPDHLPKPPKLNINLPGAAVIERTVISYEGRDNKQAKTTRRRVDSESDDDITRNYIKHSYFKYIIYLLSLKMCFNKLI
jgi:hypothetical protein